MCTTAKRCDEDHDAECAAYLTSELVTEVVKHAGGRRSAGRIAPYAHDNDIDLLLDAVERVAA